MIVPRTTRVRFSMPSAAFPTVRHLAVNLLSRQLQLILDGQQRFQLPHCLHPPPLLLQLLRLAPLLDRLSSELRAAELSTVAGGA